MFLTKLFEHYLLNCWYSCLFTATWVKKSSMNDEADILRPIILSTIQREKFSHFFYNMLDINRDDLISVQDFDYLSEVLH